MQVTYKDGKRPLLRYEEAAEYTGLSVRQLRRAVTDRRVDVVKPFGPLGTPFFDPDTLDKWLEDSIQPAEK